MRVLQLLPAMHVGGVERGAAEIARALCAAGGESIIVSRGGALADALAGEGGTHIQFDCGGKNPLTALQRARRLRALLREHAPDIVHVRSRVPAWLLALAGGWRKAVSTFHGIYSVGAYSAQMTRADAVICPSTAVREHILRHYRVAADKLHLIHRGVDRDYFDPTQADAAAVEALRQRLRLHGHTVFAMVGRVSPLKGHDLFLQALAQLRRDNTMEKPPLALIVGDDGGKRAARLRRLAQELQVADIVRFAGVCRDMRDIYASSDVVVSASKQPEAFGRTVAEALAMQRAVVAPAHGGALDIIRDGENGHLFAPGDAAQLARAMARATAAPRVDLRESVAMFSLPRMVGQTLALYENLHNNKVREAQAAGAAREAA